MRAAARAVAVAALVSAPLALAAWLDPAVLPAGLAYLLGSGRALVLVTAALAALTAAFGLPSSLAEPGPAWSERRWRGVGLALWLAALAAVPPESWSAERLSGDEPKYLRQADSLARDLDVDVASGSQAPPRLSDLPRNVRSLGRATARAVADLFTDPVPDTAGHEWTAGQWTILGRHGGSYHVQSPGLPVLLFPARLLQPSLDPQRPNSLVLVTLAALLAVAVHQAARLGAELTGSATSGLLAALALGSAAPLLAAGRHVYPEIACAALLAFVARRAVAQQMRPASLATSALVCGALPWLHVKFSLVALAALGLLLWRAATRRWRAALLGLAALPVAGLLLFDHHVTGLLRPDAFYLRAASSVYAGPGDLLGLRVPVGLVVALFGYRDGLVVMAPAAALALVALPLAGARRRAASLALLLIVAGLWLTTATHGGGAPGPPARLMAPALVLLAPLLAVALSELLERRAFRMTGVALLTAGLALSLAQHGPWQRMIDPWEGLFSSPAEDFARLLPDAPPAAGQKARPPSAAFELLRGAVLALPLLALTAWLGRRAAPRATGWPCGRPPPGAPRPGAAWRWSRPPCSCCAAGLDRRLFHPYV